MRFRLSTTLALALLSGCGMQSGPANLTVLPGGDLAVTEGSAAKGPFVLNSTVTLNIVSNKATSSSSTAAAIRPVLSPSGRSFTLNTDAMGKFDTRGIVFYSAERFVEAHVEGYYFDELTGSRSSEPVTLRGIVDISTQSLNINILTDLSRRRIAKLIRDRVAARCTVALSVSTLTTDIATCTVDPTNDFLPARKQAEREVLAAFNIPASALGTASFSDLNFSNIASLGLLSQPTAGDQILLAISALAVQIGRDGAGITEFIGQFQSDLEDDGRINNPDFALGDQIRRASSTVSYSAVARNMNGFYKTAKFVSADLEKWVDPSGGVVGVIAGRSNYYNTSVGSSTGSYSASLGTYTATGATCLSLRTREATGSLLVNGVAQTALPYLLANGSAVTLSVTNTPLVNLGVPSLNASSTLISWDAQTSDGGVTWTCDATPPASVQGVYHLAATPPGLDLFANKFISDFAKCFNLTVTNRVLATDLSNPDIPEATSFSPLCQPLAGSPALSYRSNGYRAGQQFYWLFSDGAMTKTARIVQMDVVDYFVGGRNLPTAIVNFRYVDRYGRMGHMTAVAQKDPAYASGETAGWFNVGNQQPVDINILVGARQYTSIPLQSATLTSRTLANVKIKYRTAFLPLINSKGPGITLPDGRKLSAVRVTGPGLPAEGLVMIPPQQSGLAEFDVGNMAGNLPGATPPQMLPRCGATPPSGGFASLEAMPANCPLVWVGSTAWTAPNNFSSTVTGVSLTYPTIASFEIQPTGGVWLPSNTGALMTQGAEYLFQLYYGNDATPTYSYTKRLLASMPTLAQVQAMRWVKLSNVDGLDLSTVTGAQTNPFEAIRPAEGKYTLDVAWTGQILNSVEIASANTNLQRNFYPRSTPGDSVARGMSTVTIAPQLNQDGVPREIQWSGDQSTDGLGTPVFTNLSRTVSLGHRTWDYTWRSQDYLIETYSR